MQSPEVRDAIERQARMARKRQSAEEFLKSCDKLISLPVSVAGVAAIAQPLYAALGVRTGKERMETVSAPAGKVLLRALCSLARHGQELMGVRQAGDGCVLEAVLPSDMWSFAGDLLVTVRRVAEGVEVSAATKIKGQLFDWGKSRKCLDELFRDLKMDPA